MRARVLDNYYGNGTLLTLAVKMYHVRARAGPLTLVIQTFVNLAL
jgi:hypothetical protein